MIQITYILILITLVLLASWQYVFFVRRYYIDLSLLKFRELKHETTLFLSDHVKTDLTLKEIEGYQALIMATTFAIAQLEKAKAIKFKLVKMYFVVMVVVSQKLKSVKTDSTINSPSINMFADKYVDKLNIFFKAVPFVNTRIILFFLMPICKFLFSLGIEKCKEYLENLEKILTFENSVGHHKYHCIN